VDEIEERIRVGDSEAEGHMSATRAAIYLGCFVVGWTAMYLIVELHLWRML